MQHRSSSSSDLTPASVFRITPLKPIRELRTAALSASPPTNEDGLRTPDLVDLAVADPTLHFDIRYAGPLNFLGEPVYERARALLQRPAAESLLAAQSELREEGLSLLVYDAYRPWHITRLFWDATPPELRTFVADPSHGSRHNRGCAVDVGLVDLATGRPLPMPSGYDEFTPRAYAEYPGGPAAFRRNRDRLRSAMERNDFRVYEAEWWHFDHVDWPAYPLLNLSFDEVLP